MQLCATTRLHLSSYLLPILRKATSQGLKLLAVLLKLIEVSVIKFKAREALAVCNNNVYTALAWLQKSTLPSLVRQSRPPCRRRGSHRWVGPRAGALQWQSIATCMPLVELNCKTDLFHTLLQPRCAPHMSRSSPTPAAAASAK